MSRTAAYPRPEEARGATDVIEADAPAIRELADRIAGSTEGAEAARLLFDWVRDEIGYDMAPEIQGREDWCATATLERGRGFCQQKAVLLAALLRARDIPAGVVLQDLLDHKIPPAYVALIGSQRLELHGLTCAFLDGRWVRLDPTLPRPFVERKRYRLVEFDGEGDAVLAETDLRRGAALRGARGARHVARPPRRGRRAGARPRVAPLGRVQARRPPPRPGDVAVQNSLERLFDGIATSLRENVAPAVEDPFAKAQVAATIELLANLAVRVEWRADLLREEIERIRLVLETAPDRPAVLEEPVPHDSAGLLTSRGAHLGALTAADPDEEALRELLTWQLERELGLLRTGMYK